MSKHPDLRASQNPDHSLTLWGVMLGPVVWAVHFLLCYVLVAIWCEKLNRAAPLAGIAPVILGVTLGAWAVLIWLGMRLRRPHQAGTPPADRRRFMTKLALLLVALSAVAVGFSAWPILWLELCR